MPKIVNPDLLYRQSGLARMLEAAHAQIRAAENAYRGAAHAAAIAGLREAGIEPGQTRVRVLGSPEDAPHYVLEVTRRYEWADWRDAPILMRRVREGGALSQRLMRVSPDTTFISVED